MARWEYDFQELQIVEKWLSTAQAKKFQELRDQMNAKGSQGWELLGVHTLDVVGGVTGNIKGKTTLTIWKRQVG